MPECEGRHALHAQDRKGREPCFTLTATNGASDRDERDVLLDEGEGDRHRVREGERPGCDGNRSNLTRNAAARYPWVSKAGGPHVRTEPLRLASAGDRRVGFGRSTSWVRSDSDIRTAPEVTRAREARWIATPGLSTAPTAAALQAKEAPQPLRPRRAPNPAKR